VLTLRIAVAVTIVAAMALFAAGAAAERHDRAAHATPAHSETGKPDADGGEASAAETAEAEPRLLGVDPESRGLVAVAVAGSLLLAAAVLLWQSAALLAVVGLAMLAFASLDVREIAHQVGEHRSGLIVLAAVVAVLHLAAACLAAATQRHGPTARLT
jgi:hypothetical protein